MERFIGEVFKMKELIKTIFKIQYGEIYSKY